MFSHAHNVNITNSTFNQFSGSQDAVSTVLFHHVAPGAIFDSLERSPPGKCHPGTRERMIKKINDWIHDPSPAHHVLWLDGSPGSGKSALAHSIIELLRDLHPERCGGSFFFARGSTERGRGDRLFSTLAYQLALQIPPMRKVLNDVLTHDPTIATKSIEYQLERLIIAPLLQCSKEWPAHALTVFIDGLDECGDGDEGLDTQSAILTLIAEAVAKHKLPIRFFIASRPEYWIRDSFEIGAMKSLAYHISLRDDVDADDDLRKYLEDGFEEIRLKNIRVMRSVKPPWPDPRIIDRIVQDASGQYIYASTVLRFVGKASRYCDPQEQLRILMTPGPHRALAFSDLDKLYATVLSVYPRPYTLMRVLGGLLLYASPITIRFCLAIEDTEMILVLDALSSLFNVSEIEIKKEISELMEPIFGSPLADNKIHFCHLSFREFLMDESRSGKYFVDVKMYHRLMGRKLLDVIEDNLKGGYETEPHVKHQIGLSVFNSMMGSLPFIINACGEDDLITFLSHIPRKIQDLNIGHIHFPACLMRDMCYLIDASEGILRYSWPGGLKPVPRLIPIASELKKTANLTLYLARDILSDSDQFELTPTLVRIDLNSKLPMISLHQLFNDTTETMEVTLSSLRMHRHIIDIAAESISADHNQSTHRRNLFVNLAWIQDYYRDQTHGWLSREEWGNAYISLFYQYLKALLSNSDECDHNFNLLSEVQALIYQASHFLYRVTLEEAFRRSHKIPILEVLVDTSAWMDLRSLINTPDFSEIMYYIILWLRSEISNPDERGHINRYDTKLPEKIIEAIRMIFEKHFPPENLVPKLLVVNESPWVGYGLIKFLAPVEQHQYLAIETHAKATDWGPSQHTFEDHHSVYDSLFKVRSKDAPIVYPIHTIYPRLAAFALRSLVIHQRLGDLHLYFPNSHYTFGPNRPPVEVTYFFSCLSYALPTQENLESLWALRYLTTDLPPKRHPWRPPSGFCDAISSVLTKFKQSDISEKELEQFKQWLENLKTLEIPEPSSGFWQDADSSISQAHEDQDIDIPWRIRAARPLDTGVGR